MRSYALARSPSQPPDRALLPDPGTRNSPAPSLPAVCGSSSKRQTPAKRGQLEGWFQPPPPPCLVRGEEGGEGRVPTKAENRDPGCRHGSLGAARTWEGGRMQGRLPENGDPYVPTTPRPPPAPSGIPHPSETQGRPRRGGDRRGRCPGARATLSLEATLRLQIKPNPESRCNPGPGGGCTLKTDRQAGSDKGETRTGRRQGPARLRRTPGALHLSRIRPAAPECGKRGSHGRYKGWAARMSTVQGARAERGLGAGPPGPGGGRPAPPSPPLRPGVRPRRGATPAARDSATWMPRPSPGETRKPGGGPGTSPAPASGEPGRV